MNQLARSYRARDVLILICRYSKICLRVAKYIGIIIIIINRAMTHNFNTLADRVASYVCSGKAFELIVLNLKVARHMRHGRPHQLELSLRT